MQKTTIAAELSLLWQTGEPDTAIGKTTLHVLHNDGKSALLAGVLLDQSGRRIGWVTIDGFPAGDLPASKPAGRPKSTEKHMAVLLAWALKCAELGGKMGEADDQTAGLFDYSEGKKVRDIRNPLAAKIGLDLDKGAFHIASTFSEAGPPPCSVLIERPTFYPTATGGLEILGFGVAWVEGMGERVISRRAVRVEVEEVNSDFDLATFKEKRGPIIISVIRPGR